MKKGFTLPELVIVMAVVMVLLALIVANLVRPQQRASIQGVTATLVADIKQQ